jgi:hypothetical protein
MGVFPSYPPFHQKTFTLLSTKFAMSSFVFKAKGGIFFEFTKYVSKNIRSHILIVK